MKKSILPILFFFLCFSFTQAQEFSFGLKGGLNYAMGGEIVGLQSLVDTELVYSSDTFNPESSIGFHGGAFIEMRFGNFFIRPEALYISSETEFTLVNITSSYTVDQLTIPLLVGYNVYGPIDVYAGPAYNNIIEGNLEGTANAIVVQNSPLAAQAGIKAGVGRFELDLRYSRSLASEDLQEINVSNDSTISGGVSERDGVNRANFDGRLHHVLLSLSFKLFDSSANPRRRSGGCYF
ncbi:outer membrane beta-barrel protein [Salegentibacter sp. F188]|uniref:Outer membrane beta-barrel protein n=1 Tax=Autumnicola patrickiae TaxID=3075591 RepID=A0ABU3DYR6_9FLAO|nr:outer membrane beta-barrel protein [Salegentibacter sp. F188]MDT0688847.1 outer membrane beta-barrel protein [Salegentibacter sp. F188]